MKKCLLSLIAIFLVSGETFAFTVQDGLSFFNQYQNYANTYNVNLLDMYSNNVKIIREVIKPTGVVVSIVIPSKRFFQELKIGQKTAKLKRYKNHYRNISVKITPNGYKISAERQPTRENYWLKMYQIVQPTDTGMKIVEEMMQTKVQAFLNAK